MYLCILKTVFVTESVYQMPGDPSKFYAAFTTGASDGLIGSAICTFTMDDIQEAFAGRFKEQVCIFNSSKKVTRFNLSIYKNVY